MRRLKSSITANGKFKRFIQIVLGVSVFILLLIISCNAVVIWKSKGRIYDNPNEIPSQHLGLLLGTSPITTTGIHNGSFDNRIKAATELYESGKVKKVIVSGRDYFAKERFDFEESKTMIKRL